MEPPLVVTSGSGWSLAGEAVTTLYATEARMGNAICEAAGQIAVHDSTVEWRILGFEDGLCEMMLGHSEAHARTEVPPGRYDLLITSGGVTDTLTLAVARGRTAIEPRGRQRILQLAQRVSWRAPIRSFAMWCSPKRPDGRECEAIRDALAAEPELAELPGTSPQVASGYGSGRPLPPSATAYQYVWDGEFDRVRELVREFAPSNQRIAGCSDVRVVNWRGEALATTPCVRRPAS
jgi:hypothetical protein